MSGIDAPEEEPTPFDPALRAFRAATRDRQPRKAPLDDIVATIRADRDAAEP